MFPEFSAFHVIGLFLIPISSGILVLLDIVADDLLSKEKNTLPLALPNLLCFLQSTSPLPGLRYQQSFTQCQMAGYDRGSLLYSQWGGGLRIQCQRNR